MSLDYLELIGGRSLDDFMKTDVLTVFPGFTTVNQGYGKKLLEMKDALEEFITDETLGRPFLYLILGPPGAGKSYLIKRVIDQLKEESHLKGKTISIELQTANISEMVGPHELHQLYDNILKNRSNGAFTATLLDEFDVKWEGGSAIKYLINPIYDGLFWNGSEFKTFGRCAFFFAGSYLQDREVLVKTQKLLSRVDLSNFLFDLYVEMRRIRDVSAMREISATQEFCYGHQRWRAEVDPRTDTIAYLRKLEKIKDFLSRIAGNIFEIIDISWPLSLTEEEFAIDKQEENQKVTSTTKLKPIEVVRYIKSMDDKNETFTEFGSPYSPLLMYKNVLLCERLLRVTDLLKKRFMDIWKSEACFEIDRKLLNFLTIVPLINGMRSLEQLVNKLRRPVHGRIDFKTFKYDEIVMIVHDPHEFADPALLWDKLERCNIRLRDVMIANSTQSENYVSVPLH